MGKKPDIPYYNLDLEPIDKKELTEIQELVIDDTIENMLIAGNNLSKICKAVDLPTQIVKSKIGEILKKWQEEATMMGDFGRKEALNKKINKIINNLLDITNFIKERMLETKSVKWAETLSRMFSTIARYVDMQAKIVGAYQENTLILNKIEIWKREVADGNYIEIEDENT